MATRADGVLPSSFRDPSGYVFRHDGVLYRHVDARYRAHYDHLLGSGLYRRLVDDGLLVPHKEVGLDACGSGSAYRILRPVEIPFISYPYEWCFGQLKDAALATLQIQEIALAHGMSLKDASAYNVQFWRGRPVLVDTLSFELYSPGRPWVAYRQFCEHFLAPLALMRHSDLRLNQLLRVYLEGIPLDLASRLLPARSLVRPGVLSHIYLHSRSQRRFADRGTPKTSTGMSTFALRALVDNLRAVITRMHLRAQATEWAEYYSDTNYSPAAFEHKQQVVARFLDALRPGVVWDLGANTGVFSRLGSSRRALTVAFDSDPVAVEQNYRQALHENDTNLLPLVVDLTNPSGPAGWGHEERESFLERGPADVAMALALLHHLAIGHNVPLEKIARTMHTLCNTLIVEFVPKSDSQVRRLLSSREDIFEEYHLPAFEEAFASWFSIDCAVRIEDSERTLFLMRRRPGAC